MPYVVVSSLVVLHLPGVGLHMYRHMLWRFQCPHLYWAKIVIKRTSFVHCLNKGGYGFIAHSHSSPVVVCYLPSKHSSGKAAHLESLVSDG